MKFNGNYKLVKTYNFHLVFYSFTGFYFLIKTFNKLQNRLKNKIKTEPIFNNLFLNINSVPFYHSIHKFINLLPNKKFKLLKVFMKDFFYLINSIKNKMAVVYNSIKNSEYYLLKR